jgi:hypothetical protein
MTKSFFFTYFWLNIVSLRVCIKSIFGKLYYSRMVGVYAFSVKIILILKKKNIYDIKKVKNKTQGGIIVIWSYNNNNNNVCFMWHCGFRVLWNHYAIVKSLGCKMINWKQLFWFGSIYDLSHNRPKWGLDWLLAQ